MIKLSSNLCDLMLQMDKTIKEFCYLYDLSNK